MIVTKHDFYDDRSRNLEALRVQTQRSFIINLFHPKKALLKCPDQTLTRFLTMDKGWAIYGPLTLIGKMG